jgi:hypothetical protein
MTIQVPDELKSFEYRLDKEFSSRTVFQYNTAQATRAAAAAIAHT